MSLIRSTFPSQEPYVLGQDEGELLHFLNHLAVVKVTAGDHGGLSAVEFLAPRGMSPPLHRHEHEDEFFVILDGELVFVADGEEFSGKAGDSAFLPHGRSHTFQVRSEVARFLAITASRTAEPRFDQMVSALGTPAESIALPDPEPIDPGKVAEVCLEHGIEVLGPPLPPLN